jgi:toxin ParE1/3/4
MQGYRYHPAAFEEYDEASDWYAKESPRASEDFIAAVEHAIELIVEAPRRWPRYLHGTRKMLAGQFPYLIVYRERDDLVQIIAVAHGNRRPGYWRTRLRG